ncbi:high-affinity iron transporter [Rheinheimera pacifica]|uniref:FTR1 family protein n=1 Tax=Rheinheimera pacifica TaxID=173990 RepID=UPI002857533F|nr:FTR1 family protein [Rheinheimera pacifica]MDR6984172.1 high-affinity iron transporter [Rheinheimera pacifica]
MKKLLLLCLFLVTLPGQASDKLIQLIEYIGADYKEAVQQGQVVNAAEFAEMQEFASLIPAQLPPGQTELQQQAVLLQQLVANHADEADIQQLTAAMRKVVIATMPAITLPSQAPDHGRGKALYQQNCAACHGDTGHGDGPAGTALDPTPTDFHDTERYNARSLFGLFNTISLGVADTGMVAFSHLDEQSRWDLAFYVGAIASEAQRGASKAQPGASEGKPAKAVPSVLISKTAITHLITSTPHDVTQQYAEHGAALMAVFRQQPEQFFNAAQASPLQIAHDKLELILPLVQQQHYSQAYDLAVSAYLDGFELAENNLAAVDSALKDRIEQQMLQLRQLIKQQAATTVLRAEISEIQQLLQQAQQAIDETELAPFNVFLLALLILLREGLEALLVVAAIYSVAVKTQQPRLKRSVHYGWVAALALGAVTWVAASFVITISGASRELTEGYTALTAAAILFYMGFWMHSKTSAAQWQQFIGQQVNKALKSGAYFGLGLVVFLAVYREVFETILFYQSLWLQGGAVHQSSFIAGIVTALLALLLLGVAMFKFALKLPLKTFFGSTAVLMIVLAVVMVGKGVVALQEAGAMPISPLQLPTISWLGVYPTVQGIAAQLLLLLAAIVLVVYQRRKR